MIELLLNSGVLSVSLWLGVAVFLAGLRDWLVVRRTAPEGRRVSSLTGLFGLSLFLIFLGFGTAINVGLALLKAYAAPRDIMQDVISAREFLAGRSLYPDNMNELMRDTLARESDPLSVLPFPAALREKLAARRQQGISDHWVQAHPPLMTLFVAPFVALGGTLLTQAAMLLLSLAALGLSLWLIGRRLAFQLTGRQIVLLVLASLGSEAVLATLRLGQSGLILTVLIVVAWEALHRQRPIVAGIAIAVAACLKMFPALLLLYFLCRHRRAFLAALLTTLLLWGLVAVLAGSGCLQEYRETAQGVLTEYEGFPGNVSLLGLFARLAGSAATAVAWARICFGVVGCAAVTLAVAGPWNPWGGGPAAGEQLNWEYALGVALMPLLSPISWDHYLVVLLLPLAVLGQLLLRQHGGGGSLAGFLALCMILFVPETTFTWPASQVHGSELRFAVNLLFLPLRTYAVIGLALWLGVQANHPK